MTKKRRRKLKKGPVFILLIILLLIIGFSFRFVYINTSKYLFFKGVRTSKEDLLNIYDSLKTSYFPYLRSNYYNNTNTIVELETKELKSSINFKGDVYLTDTSNYFDLLINANNSEYGLELLTKDNKVYYKIDDSKYYYTDYSEDNNFDDNIYFDILKKFYDSIDEETSNSDFSKQDIEISINDKNYSTKKISLNINQDLYDDIIESFIKKISKEDTYINALLYISDYQDKNDMFSSLRSFKIKDSLTYSVYLYKSNGIRHEIDEYKLFYTFVDNCFEINKNNSYIKIADNKISLFIEGMLYGNGKYDDKSFLVDFVDYSNDSLGKLAYSISNKNKQYIYDLDLSINLELIKYNIKSNSKIELNKKVPSIDLNNSVTDENMSSNDKKVLDEMLAHINGIIDF